MNEMDVKIDINNNIVNSNDRKNEEGMKRMREDEGNDNDNNINNNNNNEMSKSKMMKKDMNADMIITDTDIINNSNSHDDSNNNKAVMTMNDVCRWFDEEDMKKKDINNNNNSNKSSSIITTSIITISNVNRDAALKEVKNVLNTTGVTSASASASISISSNEEWFKKGFETIWRTKVMEMNDHKINKMKEEHRIKISGEREKEEIAKKKMDEMMIKLERMKEEIINNINELDDELKECNEQIFRLTDVVSTKNIFSENISMQNTLITSLIDKERISTSTTSTTTIENENNQENNIINNNNNETLATLFRTLQSIRIAKDKIVNEMNMKSMCCICNENAREILFNPCNHLLCCKVCCNQMTICPICRESIKIKTPVFIS